jgi:hypothetical protein
MPGARLRLRENLKVQQAGQLQRVVIGAPRIRGEIFVHPAGGVGPVPPSVKTLFGHCQYSKTAVAVVAFTPTGIVQDAPFPLQAPVQRRNCDIGRAFRVAVMVLPVGMCMKTSGDSWGYNPPAQHFGFG